MDVECSVLMRKKERHHEESRTRKISKHLEVQMIDMNEVSKAYERCKSSGFQISMSVGQRGRVVIEFVTRLLQAFSTADHQEQVPGTNLASDKSQPVSKNVAMQ